MESIMVGYGRHLPKRVIAPQNKGRRNPCSPSGKRLGMFHIFSTSTPVICGSDGVLFVLGMAGREKGWKEYNAVPLSANNNNTNTRRLLEKSEATNYLEK